MIQEVHRVQTEYEDLQQRHDAQIRDNAQLSRYVYWRRYIGYRQNMRTYNRDMMLGLEIMPSSVGMYIGGGI